MDMKSTILAVILIAIALFIGNSSCFEYFTPKNINYDEVYKRNRDLDFAAGHFGINVTELEKIKSNQVAPIMGCQNDIDSVALWGTARLPSDFGVTSTRIPDQYSTLTTYNHPIVHRI
jgi:hypothetical protein